MSSYTAIHPKQVSHQRETTTCSSVNECLNPPILVVWSSGVFHTVDERNGISSRLIHEKPLKFVPVPYLLSESHLSFNVIIMEK